MHNSENENSTALEALRLWQAAGIDIGSELAGLKELLVGLNTGDRTKIANALNEAADEVAKPQPDKTEILGALQRALGYAGKATDYGDRADKITIHVENIATWLGNKSADRDLTDPTKLG